MKTMMLQKYIQQRLRPRLPLTRPTQLVPIGASSAQCGYEHHHSRYVVGSRGGRCGDCNAEGGIMRWNTTTTANNNDNERKTKQKNKQRKRFKHIPEPVWSITNDLQLSTNHPPIPDDELYRLARLTLLNVRPSTTASSRNSSSSMKEEQQQQQWHSLKQDVGNMMHMIQLVTEYDDDDVKTKKKKSNDIDDEDDDDEEDTGSIYDVVRTGGCRVDRLSRQRQDLSDNAIPATTTTNQRRTTIPPQPRLRDVPELDPLHDDETQQANNVWNKLLQPKTIRKGGGHDYFAIQTGGGGGVNVTK